MAWIGHKVRGRRNNKSYIGERNRQDEKGVGGKGNV